MGKAFLFHLTANVLCVYIKLIALKRLCFDKGFKVGECTFYSREHNREKKETEFCLRSLD